MNGLFVKNLKRYFHCSISNKHKLRLYYQKYATVKDPARQNPNYFEEQAAELPLSKDYFLKFFTLLFT